jgi:peptidoglycan hydrolase-like protein with peptidoglycan-binding domain
MATTYTVKAGDNYNPFTGSKLTTSQKTVGTVISAPSTSTSSGSTSTKTTTSTSSGSSSSSTPTAQTYTVKAGDNYNPFTGATLTTAQKTPGTVISSSGTITAAPSTSSGSSSSTSTSTTTPKTTTTTTTPTSNTLTTYVVKAGDNYNPFTGAALTTAQKTPGTVLTNPSTAQTTPTTPTTQTTPTTSPTSYTVKAGDNYNPFTGVPLTTEQKTPGTVIQSTGTQPPVQPVAPVAPTLPQTFSERLNLAQEAGITNYTGTATQNAKIEAYQAQQQQIQQQGETTPTGANTGANTGQNGAVMTPSYIGQTLQQGSTGADVSKVQSMLSSYGLTVDGQYGPKTMAAVKQFQASKGLVADGIVGPKTWQALAGTTANPVSSIEAGMTTPNPMQIDETTGEPIIDNIPDTGNPTIDALMERLANSAPQVQWSEVYKQVVQDSGIGKMNGDFESATEEYTKLQDKKNDEAQDINNNPWYTEGERVKRLEQLDKRYEGKEIILQNKLKLLETQINNAREDAKFITGQTMAQMNANAQLNQEVIMKAIEIAEAQIAAENKLSPGIAGEYEFAVSQGYSGTFSQYQNEDANRKVAVAKAGAATTTILPTGQNLETKETSEALGTVNSINNILSNPNFASAFGATGIVKTMIPGTPEYTLNSQIQQIKDKLSLAARGQLKGQGAVSNFEGLMLQNAQTSLKTGMNPTDARQEMINIAGALTTSTGGQAKVQLKEPNGTIYTVMSDSRGITQAIADGLSVKYVQ